ncbi:4-dimethylallyl tryptophan synthase [Bisporella sp. PMI_857]|nr:4-dimethylallyl tryptophan synthase [Bisporella sp. PMI_857]
MSPIFRKTKDSTHQEEVYKTLSDVFEITNNEHKLWWHSTAPMFAKMLQIANYDIHSQYRYLGIFRKHIIPFLGSYPTNECKDRWLSILTRYGTPFELSLNCSDSLVRYTYEPINAATGTSKDPFNTNAIWESLHDLTRIQPGVDLEWFRHFKNDLTVNDTESAYLLKNDLAGGEIKSQNKLALDLKGGQFVLKTYIYPGLKAIATGNSIRELMFDSVRAITKQHSSIRPAFAMLEDYISGHLADDAKIRIVLAGFEMVQELWDLLQIRPGLQAYPEPYLQLGTIPDEQLPSMANYTLHHDDPIPEPQVYFTVFGMKDMAVADALTTFFERHGWTEMARNYKDSLRAYYPYEDHEKMNYVHAYISFSYRNNKPYLSVYLHSFETGNWPASPIAMELQGRETNIIPPYKEIRL